MREQINRGDHPQIPRSRLFRCYAGLTAGEMMPNCTQAQLSELLRKHHPELMQNWNCHRSLRQTGELLELFESALTGDSWADAGDKCWLPVRTDLRDFARETAHRNQSLEHGSAYVLHLKGTIRRVLEEEFQNSDTLLDDCSTFGTVVDQLFLSAAASFQSTREDLIKRQQSDLLELSTPILRISDDLVVIPLIGTIDSVRAGLIMTGMLEEIAKHGARIAIIDLTGIAVLDTASAAHLYRTMQAAQLLGTECLLSGIRPQIALTMVSLGLDLKKFRSIGTLADAVRLSRTPMPRRQ